MSRLEDAAEQAYRRFIRHAEHCTQCGPAGGEWAENAALCPTGRTLAQTWEGLEQAAARLDAGALRK